VKRNIILSVLLLICISVNANAQQQTINVLNVTVVGNETASENIIKINSGFVEGAILNGQQIQDGIKKLWRLRLFSDINVFVDRETPDGVYLIISVQEYPRLNEVKYVGNEKIKTKNLKKDIIFIRGQVISPHVINKAVRDIKAKYDEEGYYNAAVDVSTSPAGDNVDLIFTIDEGKKVRIREIVFKGNENFSNWTLQRQMKETKARTWYRFYVSGKFDEDKFDEDKRNLLKYYRDHGYRDARILSTNVELSEDNRRISLVITLEEGNPYYYGDIAIEGNEIYKTDFLKKSLESAGIARGEPYKENAFEVGLDLRVRSPYMDNGYLYAQIVPELTPRDKDTLDVKIIIQENEKVFIRRIEIAGNDRTRDYVIRREMRAFPGDVFNREALIRSQSDIFRLNFFSNVIPDIAPVDDKHVDLEITVEEKSSDRANMSMGYSELDGLIGSVGIDIMNLMGRGQQLSTEYQRGQSYQYINLGFSEPWLYGRPNSVGVNFYYSERGASRYYSYPYDINVIGASVRFGRRFRWPDSYFYGSWSLNMTQKNYANIDDEITFLAHNPTGLKTTRGNSFVQTILRDSKNRPEFPTTGSTVSFSTKLSGGLFGGHEEFVKNELKIKWWTPVFWKVVLYQDVYLGNINSFGKYAVIPYDERFYMGGAGMVSYTTPLRGYEDRSVGPVRSTSYMLGGKAMAKYSLELRIPISENPTMYVLAFGETGQVWNAFKDVQMNRMVRSTGVGARIFMPMIGMLGFDVGYGFDNPYDPNGKPYGWKTHFVFGMPF
jgi:outer membrane protein insertion porin family